MDAALKILLIEDNPDHAFLVRREFRNCGVPVELHHVSDSAAALEWLQGDLPDAILLDIKLPGRDGFELLILLKTNERTRDVPVILVTSSPVPADIERGAQLGATSYLTKPVQAAQVLAILQRQSNA